MINVCAELLTDAERSNAQAEGQIKKPENMLGDGFAPLPDREAIDKLAQYAYYSYGAATDYKDFQGNPTPEWKDLPSEIRLAWRNATSSVVCSVGYTCGIKAPESAKAAYFGVYGASFSPCELIIDSKSGRVCPI